MENSHSRPPSCSSCPSCPFPAGGGRAKPLPAETAAKLDALLPALLDRALRAGIDAADWRTLYATQIRPVERPESDRLATNVINHYGDAVLKVYEV